jgi:hypothetical protein
MRKRISNYFLGIGVVFAIYLVALSIVGNSSISPFFHHGFWFVLGSLLGFRLCSYLYERAFNDESEKRKGSFKKKFENPGGLN